MSVMAIFRQVTTVYRDGSPRTRQSGNMVCTSTRAFKETWQTTGPWSIGKEASDLVAPLTF
jgi:hypothetical protein